MNDQTKSMLKTILLIFLAVALKMIVLPVLGFIFTNDFVKYTSFLSRTSDLSFGFLLYLLISDLAVFLIIQQVTKTFLFITQSIKTFFIICVCTLMVFWSSDFFFLMEIKSNNLVRHFFAAIIVLNKYIVFFLASFAYNMELDKLSEAQKKLYFYDHSKFVFRKLISERIFLSSKFLYNPAYNIPIYCALLIYINYILLHLYQNTVGFYTSLLVCCLINSYLLIFVVHQAFTIFKAHKKYVSRFGGIDLAA